FCYVGLERSSWLQRRFGARIEWRPFDLHPEYPPEGIPRAELERRYGPGVAQRHAEMFERAGLPHSASLDRVPNSRRALMLAERLLVPGAQPHEVFEHALERLGHAPLQGS